jgi:hypothetical protein
MIGEIKCHHCGQAIQFDDEQAGTLLKCPVCEYQTRATVPPTVAAAREHDWKMKPCEDCGKEISRRSVFCPSCGGFNTVPFRLVWLSLSLFMVASSIFKLWMLLCDWIFH